MPDSIERTIYKLEIDDSSYQKGVESLTTSTNKLSQAQEAANKTLAETEAQLKKQADLLDKAKKALDNYAGADEAKRKQLEKTFDTQKKVYDQVNKSVNDAKANFELAKKAADDFNTTVNKANGLGQGKVPGPAPIVPPVVPTPFKFEDFNLNEILSQAAPEFEKLRTAIAAAEAHMKTLNAEDEEFKQLAPIVEKAKIALQQYDETVKNTGKSHTSLRAQIRQGREELVKLEQAGKDTSQEYINLEKHVAQLTHEFTVQQERLRILGSQTRLLDFGKAAITTATASFQAFTSVEILAGGQSQELEKKTMQLIAAIGLLNSLEEISNQLRRGGVVVTNLQSAAQTVYTAVVGTSTGALKAFRIALLATGIGAAVVAIGFLVSKYLEHKEAVKESGQEQKIFNDIQKEAIKNYSSEVTHLELIRTKLTDLNIPLSKRTELAKAYNKTADDGNKLDLQQISNIDLVNAAIDRQITKLKQRALARAAESVIGQKAEEFFKLQVEFEEKFPAFSDKAVTDLDKKVNDLINIRKKALGISKEKIDPKEILAFADLPKAQLDKIAQGNDKFKILLDDQTRTRLAFLAKQKKDIEEARSGANIKGSAEGANISLAQDAINSAKEELDRALKVGADIIGATDLFDQKDIKDKVDNVFKEEKAKLEAQLAEARNNEAAGIKRINDEFAAKLEAEKVRIQGLVKDKKLLGNVNDPDSQAGILFGIAKDVNKAQLDKALKDFNKQVIEERKKLVDDLRSLESKNIEDRLNLIQDEFKRRAATIEINEKKELDDQKHNTEERLQALELDKFLFSEKEYQELKNRIIEGGEQAALLILQKYAQERQNLAADSFKKILDAYQNAIGAADLIRDEGIAAQIRNLSNRFLTGKISFEKYQEDLTKIQREAEAIRRNATLETQRGELAELDRHISQIKDKASKEYQDLTKQRDELRKTIANGEKEDAQKDAEDKNATDNSRTKKIIEYVDSIGKLADSVIQFWQKANEAETKALDASISLQEKRVEAAQRIAERGNAEYLKQEEDRLNELQVKRENAARRQLAIDAALQASQILVAITGAVAKIATPGIGVAETIGEIAIIVGALATGYGLVKSLQGNQPKLAKGDPYVKRNGHPSGTDTIPAWLNEGEAVIPTDTNRAYHPTIQAVYHKKIPAEDINRFVTNYHRIKSVPQVNYDRIKSAAELHVNSDGKMIGLISEQNRKIDENNDLLRQVHRALKTMGVNVNMDKNGIAVSVMEVVEQIKIDSKT